MAKISGLTSKEKREFENLKKDCGITDDNELIRQAKLFMRWGVDKVKKGRIIASINDDGKYTEVEIPAFKFVRDNI